MKFIAASTLGWCLLGFGSNPALPARVFQPAVEQIRSKARIPILLPSQLPTEIPEPGIQLARGEMREDGYFISLYASADANVSYVAGFGGSARILRDRDLPNSSRVRLSGGRDVPACVLRRVLLPRICGGSKMA